MPVTINATPEVVPPVAVATDVGGTITVPQPDAPNPIPIAGQPPVASDEADIIVLHHGITDGKGNLYRMGDKLNSAKDLPPGAVEWLLSQGAIAMLDKAPAKTIVADVLKGK